MSRLRQSTASVHQRTSRARSAGLLVGDSMDLGGGGRDGSRLESKAEHRCGNVTIIGIMVPLETREAPEGPPIDGPRRADARRNRERVLAAAEAVFAESGLKAPVEEVARRAGVGVGTVWRKFPTQQALVAARP